MSTSVAFSCKCVCDFFKCRCVGCQFSSRHIGPRDAEVKEMVKLVGFNNLDELITATVPAEIRFKSPKESVLPEPKSEVEALAALRAISLKNKVRATWLRPISPSDTSATIVKRYSACRCSASKLS